MKKITVLVCLLFLSVAYAQELGKVDIKKNGSYGMKKLAEAPKKIFIQEFFINYQMVFDQVEIAKGGREVGGGVRGKAKAQLVLGVQGISADDLQEVTDKLYQEYIAKLKADGFEIVTAKDVAQDPYFEGWQLHEGGTPQKAYYPGYVATAPTGFDYLTKKITKKGKVKKSAFDTGMGTSKNLGGILIARVNLVVPFVKEAESQGSRALTKTFGGVAKVVAKTEFGIAPMTSVTMKGALGKKVVSLYSSSLIAYKESLKNQAILMMKPKKKIIINDVFESKKYKAVKSASQDLWGTDYGAVTVFSASDEVLEKMQAIPCDAQKYKDGVYKAGTVYLSTFLDEFVSYL